jgi:hypothetical protein
MSYELSIKEMGLDIPVMVDGILVTKFLIESDAEIDICGNQGIINRLATFIVRNSDEVTESYNYEEGLFRHYLLLRVKDFTTTPSKPKHANIEFKIHIEKGHIFIERAYE